MINMLVVDDETYAVRAILQGIDWRELGFDGVFSATDADDAMAILQEHRIDLMICDIEMPGMNGLELTEWAVEHYPGTETIFLTGHADFSFAQKAIGLGSFDYLLKPVKHEKLKEVVLRALDKIKQIREQREFHDSYKQFVKLWEAQKPVLIERFWQDIVAERLVPTESNLRESPSAANLAIGPETTVLPILLSVEHWHKEFNSRDEAIMEYALRNAAIDFLLKNPAGGCIIEDKRGLNFALLYGEGDCDGESFPGRSELEAACRAYVAGCAQYFYCTLSCYVGPAVTIDRLPETCHRLIELEHDNFSETGTVRFLEEECAEAGKSIARKKAPLPADWTDWVVLLETGNKAELLRRLDSMFAALQQEKADVETMGAAHHFLLHLMYHVAHQRGFSVKEWAGSRKALDDASVTRSLSHLKAWAVRTLTAGLDAVAQQEQQTSAVIDKVKRFVEANLRDVTRESIASHVYLNSAYLSRLFKKETGQSLVDYIIQVKMNHAKMMLTESNRKISDICESLGYDNFSHFGKTFKKAVGITPQEYRKRYQGLGSGRE